jgi:hypothetical protein
VTARLPLVLGSDGLPQQVQVADSITVATQASSDNATNVASTAFVQNVVGAVSVAVTGGAVSLTAAQAAAGTLLLTGVLTSNVVISFAAGATSAYTRAYTVANGTTGAFTVTLQACATTPANSLPVSQGMSAEVYTTGASIFTAGSDLQQLAVFTSTLRGLAPLSGGGTANYLRADGTWATPGGAGVGTVTSVSVTTAAGVSGSVANPTSTPAITITLGAITPSSVAATGAVTGSNLSGTNTGDQSLAAYATLASPTFTGSATLPNIAGSLTVAGSVTSSAGNLVLSAVTSATAGSILVGTSAIHCFSNGSGTTGSFYAGYQVGNYTMSGYNNVAIGAFSLKSSSSASNNIAIGIYSLQSVNSSTHNIALGYSALGSQTNTCSALGNIVGGSGYTNGTYPGVQLTYVSGPTAVTYPTATIVVSGGVVTSTVFLTRGAGFTANTTIMTASAASLGGTGSGFTVQGTSVYFTGANIAVGFSALASCTLGSENVAVGYGVGINLVLGCYNTLIGESAGNAISSNSYCVCLGYLAGQSTTTVLGSLTGLSGGSGYTNGTYNAVALSRAYGPTAASYGTANIVVSGGAVTSVTIVNLGTQFQEATTGLTTAAANIGGTGSGFFIGINSLKMPEITVVGSAALGSNVSGTGHTAIGRSAGVGVGGNEATVGDDYCTFVGHQASRSSVNANSTFLTNMTAIGYGAKTTASNQVALGNSSVTTTLLQGVVSTTTAFKLPSYTVGTVPAASTGAGCLVYISNPTTGNPRAYTSNGTNWYDGAGTLLA